MTRIWERSAALLALYIGVMAVYAGIQPLLGRKMAYLVINWLPLYNYTAGLLTIVVAVLLWLGRPWARWAAAATLAAHGVVMGILAIGYAGTVAPDSLRAMVTRLAVWLVVLVLIVVQVRRDAARLPRPA